MWTKPYGSTGKKVSVIGFGGMRFANGDDIDANAEIVLHAYRKGITYFDTAPGYCKDRSEEIMGAAFRQMKPGTFFASTKCMKPDGGEFRRVLERSLKRLGLQKIHFHHIWCLLNPGEWGQRKAGGAVAAALKAKDEGLIDHVVASTHMSGQDLHEVIADGVIEGVTLGYSAINFPYREAGVRAAGEAGLGVVTMNPLGGGLIPQNAERFDFLRGPADMSVVQAALRFNVSDPHVTCALVGFTTKQHVEEAVAAVQGFRPYGLAHVQWVRRHILESFADLCTGCGYCLPCPHGVPIPKLMDTYNMRLLGQDDKALAGRLKWHWGIAASEAAACESCGQCEEACTQHLPIMQRLKEIAKLPHAK